jgi:hypothetical protein
MNAKAKQKQHKKELTLPDDDLIAQNNALKKIIKALEKKNRDNKS